jgi:beta-N-acetylhexosaminidase
MVLGKVNSEVGLHLMVGFRGVDTQEELKSIIRDFHIGGIIIYRRNVEGRDQLLNLLAEAQAFARETLGRGLLVAIDQEGGRVQRLAPHFTELPAADDLAERGPEAVSEWAEKAALDLRQCGIQINFAPVLDVSSGEETHFMKDRCLGSDPQRVAELGRLWITTLQKNGISATAKHYPGLGLAESDPHHFAPIIHWQNQESLEEALLPFRAAVKAGVHCVMTSHARYPYLDPDWPATLSPIINADWLRTRLQFGGVLFSDDLDMAAVHDSHAWEEMVIQGVRSTVDLFLLCQHSANIEPLFRVLHDATFNGSFPVELRHNSLERIRNLFRMHAMSMKSAVE